MSEALALAMPQAPAPAAAMQRAHGRVEVVLKSGPRGEAAIARLWQEGSARAILPRLPGPAPEVVFLNTAGGLTGGDRLEQRLTLAPGLAAVATTQTAERAYAAAGGRAEVAVRLTVGAGGWLDWLPQETILFQDAALARRVTVDLAPGAGCLLLESVVLGREAMGETLSRLDFRDHRMILREGAPLWAEPLRIDGRTLARAGAAAVLGGARALATLVVVDPRAEEMAALLARAPAAAGVAAAASALPGRLVMRALARDGLVLRRRMLAAIAALRPQLPTAGPLPRVWQA